MSIHQINGIRIRTNFEYPPIPIRSCDWSAVNDDTYDVDCDQDGFFTTCPIGRGATEQEAIDDLLLRLEENCPGHVAFEGDPKICARCNTHINSLRPDDGP